MQTIFNEPNAANLTASFRKDGYAFEVAVADILDNSVSAGAKKIAITALQKPNLIFAVLDDGCGMDAQELQAAMRLGSKDPNAARERSDLGRFGLGLKTASFSQCEWLTMLSKKAGKLSAYRWDLEHLGKCGRWEMFDLSGEAAAEYGDFELFQKLQERQNGTLLIWQKIDKVKPEEFSEVLARTKNHLRLVFHQFLEGRDLQDEAVRKVSIEVNGDCLEPLNPFNTANTATQKRPKRVCSVGEARLVTTAFVLPHKDKCTPEEWERHALARGYLRESGFYLYRAHRLLAWGEWFGAVKQDAAAQLVRIGVEVGNDQDELWNIDIKKSRANPTANIVKCLKEVASEAVKRGAKVYQKRTKSTSEFQSAWQQVDKEGKTWFVLNKDYPVLTTLKGWLDEEQNRLLEEFLRIIEADLPIESIKQLVNLGIVTPNKLTQQGREQTRESVIEAMVQNGFDAEVAARFVENLACFKS